MRKLSEEELIKIQKAIVAKELISAEVLMEIYDHYVSHLEGFGEEDFEEQLDELEQKFTPRYCKTIQLDFKESSEKEISRMQWSIWKSYFTWPKGLATISFFAIFLLVWIYGSDISRILAICLPILIGTLLNGWLWYKSYKKVAQIRKLVKSHTTLESSYLPNSVNQFVIIFITLNFIFQVSRGLKVLTSMESLFFAFLALVIFFAFVSYMFSFYAACKLKSKTALI